MIKEVYKSEDGIKELVQMFNEGCIFKPIISQDDLYIHNYVVKKLETLGFSEANVERIIKYVMEHSVPKTQTEEEKVKNEYFGDNAPSI